MINIIVATTDNDVIGVNGLLPWKKQKDDMKSFRKNTIDYPVVMGRKTYNSIPFDLDRRHQIVLTRNGEIGQGQFFCGVGNTTVVNSVEKAIEEACKHNKDFYVVGGSEIYNLFLPIADRILRTVIHTKVDGDVFFKVPKEWNLIEENRQTSDNYNEYEYTYQIWTKAPRG